MLLEPKTRLACSPIAGHVPADEVSSADSAMVSGTAFGAVPSFWAPARPPRPEPLRDFPSAGERIDDFELIRELGAGACGRVFLAHQVSLDRQVALKVTADRGSEARMLAGLQHDHIVPMFSETVDRARGLRLLCMQYVPGDTLAGILEALGGRPHSLRTGRSILQILDGNCPDAAAFHATALRERRALAECDGVAAACWLGVRLAEALDYAHAHGVLHCDIKPANILVHPSGRPFLADFGLSMPVWRIADNRPELFGGTLGYMAPEHLEALAAKDPLRLESLDTRSDICSLGVVLFELATGRHPLAHVSLQAGRSLTIDEMKEQWRLGPPSAREIAAELPESFDHILRRCLHPDPDRRYSTAAELAAELETCREHGR